MSEILRIGHEGALGIFPHSLDKLGPGASGLIDLPREALLTATSNGSHVSRAGDSACSRSLLFRGSGVIYIQQGRLVDGSRRSWREPQQTAPRDNGNHQHAGYYGRIEPSRGIPEPLSVLVSHNSARLAARGREVWIEAIGHYERYIDGYTSRVAAPL